MLVFSRACRRGWPHGGAPSTLAMRKRGPRRANAAAVGSRRWTSVPRAPAVAVVCEVCVRIPNTLRPKGGRRRPQCVTRRATSEVRFAQKREQADAEQRRRHVPRGKRPAETQRWSVFCLGEEIMERIRRLHLQSATKAQKILKV